MILASAVCISLQASAWTRNICWWMVTCVDCRFRSDQEGYACGGSGSLFRTDDGGKSWKRDRSTDQVAGNLYAIKFSENGNGFILGNDGILLRYIG